MSIPNGFDWDGSRARLGVIMTQAVTEISAGRELKMLAVLALGFMLAIWVVVIWGAAYFNQNVN